MVPACRSRARPAVKNMETNKQHPLFVGPIELNDLLQKEKEILVIYLQAKIRLKDWHGVADAAMDIRDIEAKQSILRDFIESQLPENSKCKSSAQYQQSRSSLKNQRS